MKVRYSVFADSAAINSDDGTYSLLRGGINIVKSPAFPLEIISLVYLVSLEFETTELGNLCIVSVEIVGPNGTKPAFPNRQIGFVPEKRKGDFPNVPVSSNVMFHLNGMSFPIAGEYVFTVRVNESPVGEDRLHIMEGF